VYGALETGRSSNASMTEQCSNYGYRQPRELKKPGRRAMLALQEES